MCATCGCGDDTGTRVTLLDALPAPVHQHPHDHGGSHGDALPHDHSHPHDHNRPHPPDHSGEQHKHAAPNVENGDRTVVLEQQILAKNIAAAERNRGWLAGRGVLALNLMSSPGAGKTTLLERTIARFAGGIAIGVIEGDQETPLDAERIRACGSPVVQINTGAGCHLDADMVQQALTALDPRPESLVVIENVGNLVCPALFDLGEAYRVVLTSVTEGADKPMKYPHMYRAADLVLINKMDLLPYVDFDIARFTADVGRLNPRASVVSLTATSDDGIGAWCEWLTAALPAEWNRPNGLTAR
jgi:hydrogenase nickel incorporation protein HypB